MCLCKECNDIFCIYHKNGKYYIDQECCMEKWGKLFHNNEINTIKEEAEEALYKGVANILCRIITGGFDGNN